MRYGVLGPLQVSDDARLIDIAGHKPRALLAILLLHGNRVVSADRLIDALWQETPPRTAAKALQVYVSQLRKLLGPHRLETKPPGYVIAVADGELDLECFRLLAGEGKTHEALSLWRGPPLADFAFERFAQDEIARLEEERLACLEARIDADLLAGRHAGLVGELEALNAEHPRRERLRRQLMIALYRSGQQAAALESFHAARAALVDELGIEPSRELRELHQAMLRQDDALEAPAHEPIRAADAQQSAFVGRQAESTVLSEALDDALAGHGRIVLLGGEPGIGKSRLAEELASQARARGADVLVGRCWEAGGAPAYWPWTQSLRSYLRTIEPEQLREQAGDGAAELAHLLPELRGLVPGVSASEPPNSEGARFRLFHATAEFLQRAAAHRPLVLVLDDLHAADADSLLLLQLLARELGSNRLLVVGAFRDVDPVVGDELGALLAEVAREPAARRMSLRGLSAEDVGAYLEQTAPGLASPELVAALSDRTEGNPLFVSETVRLLAAEAAPEGDGTLRLAIPASVRDVIVRRLAQLSAECRELLVHASVLGRDFALGTLARCAGEADEIACLALLEEAMAERIIADSPGGAERLRFTHILIRDVLYESVTAARRIQLHRSARAALEASPGAGTGGHLAELAHHAIAGREFGPGVRYARLAADQALALLAYEEATRLYEAALDALAAWDGAGDETRCELLRGLGEAQARAGETPAAKETFALAAEIARRTGLGEELARAAAGYGGRIVWGRAGDDARLVPMLEEGLAALAGQQTPLRACLLARLAGARRDDHQRERRESLSREAVDLARRIGDASTLAYVLVGRAYSIVAPDTVEECLAIGSELFELAVASGDREQVFAAHMVHTLAHLVLGDIAAASADLASASAVATQLRQPAQLWQVDSCHALLTLAAGRLDEADVDIRDSYALGKRALPQVASATYELQRSILCDFRGELERAEPEIRGLVAEHPARPAIRCALTYMHARLGRRGEAQAALDDLAADVGASLPFDQEWLFGMSLLAEASALLGDSGSAARLYPLLLPWAALNAADLAEGFRGSVARYLGLLASTSGKSAAARHYEDALMHNARMGARPWLARTQQDYAQMLHVRNRSGDRERARELAEQAAATFAELGMAG